MEFEKKLGRLEEIVQKMEKATKEKQEKWEKSLILPKEPGYREPVKVTLLSKEPGRNLESFPNSIEMGLWQVPGETPWDFTMRSEEAFERFDETPYAAMEVVDDENNVFLCNGTVFWLPDDESCETGRLAIEASQLRFIRKG